VGLIGVCHTEEVSLIPAGAAESKSSKPEEGAGRVISESTKLSAVTADVAVVGATEGPKASKPEAEEDDGASKSSKPDEAEPGSAPAPKSSKPDDAPAGAAESKSSKPEEGADGAEGAEGADVVCIDVVLGSEKPKPDAIDIAGMVGAFEPKSSKPRAGAAEPKSSKQLDGASKSSKPDAGAAESNRGV
jgi:hypothetical protein